MPKKPSRAKIENYIQGPRHSPGWTRTSDRSKAYQVITAGLGNFNWLDLYHSLISIPWSTFFSIIVAWYLVVNGVFALAYYWIGTTGFSGLTTEATGVGLFFQCYFFSVHTFATIGYGNVIPIGHLSNWIVVLESLIGLLSVAVITGLLFARFSRPKARLEFSQVALMTQMDGVPHLNFRVSNARANHVVEANVAVSVIKFEQTQEGQRYRNWYDLKLERSHTQLLSLTWTVVHPIDKDSPLYGINPEEYQKDDIQVFVTVWGVDDNLGQTIYSRYLYRPQDIIWGAQFSDMIFNRGDKVLVDRSKLHQFEPQAKNIGCKKI